MTRATQSYFISGIFICLFNEHTLALQIAGTLLVLTGVLLISRKKIVVSADFFRFSINHQRINY